MSSGVASIAEGACDIGETGSAGSSSERDGMRGMVGGRHPVRTGAAAPFVVSGVAGERMGVERLILASRWVSMRSENCADSRIGRRWKAPRSEVDGDATISDARCMMTMIISAIAQ